MLVVFDIDEDVLRPGAASMLAQRETLWVFCKNHWVLPGWKVEGNTFESLTITAPEPVPPLKEPPVKPNKRTTAKKIHGTSASGHGEGSNGPVSEG